MEVREASDDDGHPDIGAACHGRIAEPALSHCVGIAPELQQSFVPFSQDTREDISCRHMEDHPTT